MRGVLGPVLHDAFFKNKKGKGIRARFFVLCVACGARRLLRLRVLLLSLLRLRHGLLQQGLRTLRAPPPRSRLRFHAAAPRPAPTHPLPLPPPPPGT